MVNLTKISQCILEIFSSQELRSQLSVHLWVQVDVCTKFEEILSRHSWDITWTDRRPLNEQVDVKQLKRLQKQLNLKNMLLLKVASHIYMNFYSLTDECNEGFNDFVSLAVHFDLNFCCKWKSVFSLLHFQFLVSGHITWHYSRVHTFTKVTKPP